MSFRVAIVGAGVAGLACAGTLVRAGLEVVLFDKGARPGGRLATRNRGGWSYDHGAQYFTARDPEFVRAVRSWIERKVVQEWRGRLIAIEGGRRRRSSSDTVRYVGVPEMNTVAAELASGLDVRSRVRVSAVERKGGGWRLRHDGGEEGTFDGIVINVPAPQAVPLLEEAPALQRRAGGVAMQGCWAVLLGFEEALPVDFDGAFVNDGPLSWVARNGSKPGRRGETWVLHASPGWTDRHLDASPDAVGSELVEAFAAVAACEPPRPADLQVHRWSYAMPARALPERCLVDEQALFALCGDWCGGPKIEGAYLSGAAAGRRLLDLTPPARR